MDKLEFAKQLEKRTAKFADQAFILCRKIQKDTVTLVIISQLTRAAGSVGANYIEANESLSTKDFYHRIRICRKEAKESRFWLHRLIKLHPSKEKDIQPLLKEALEFILIFSKVIISANK